MKNKTVQRAKKRRRRKEVPRTYTSIIKEHGYETEYYAPTRTGTESYIR